MSCMDVKNFFEKNKGLCILIFIFALIKLIILPKLNFLYWDEAVYLSIGKYIYSAGSSGFFEIIRPLGLPLVLGWFWLLKLDYILFSKIFMIIISLGYILTAYFLSAKLFNKKIGILTVTLLIVTPVFFGFSSLILTGVPAAMFILLAIYFFMQKNNLFLSGLFTALAFLFRFPAGLVLVVVCAGLILQYIQEKKKQILQLAKRNAIYVGSFVLFTLPYIIFNYIKYHNVTSELNHALFRPWIMGIWHQGNPAGWVGSGLSSVLYYPIQLFLQNIFFIFVIVAIVFWIKNKNYRNYRFNTILIALVLFLVYFSYISNKQIRFSILFLPFLAMLSAYGVLELYKLAKKRFRKDTVKTIIIILCFAQFLAVTNIFIGNSIGHVLTRPRPMAYPALTEFFESNSIMGDVMATEPIASAYIDNRFIPNFYSYDTLIGDFSSNRSAMYLIHYPEGIWCPEYNFQCFTDRKRVTQYFMQEYNLVFFDNETELYVFSKNFSLPPLNMEQLQKTRADLVTNPNAVDSVVVFRIENAGSLFREDKKGNIWQRDKFEKLNSIFEDTKVTWSIIPADIEGLNEKSRHYLREYVANHSINIAQKGYEHKDNGFGSEFRGLPHSKQMDKIIQGRIVLENEFGKEITLFIPPFNSADENTLRILDALDYAVYSSTPGDQLFVTDRNINRYDQLIPFTDWQKGGNLDFDTLKAQFDSFNKFKDYIIITIEYYMLSDENFETIERFLGYVQSKNIIVMDLKGLDRWYRFRESVDFSIDNQVVNIYPPESEFDDYLTLGFYVPSNFTISSTLETVKIISFNEAEINVCLNSKCYKLEPNILRKIEITE